MGGTPAACFISSKLLNHDYLSEMNVNTRLLFVLPLFVMSCGSAEEADVAPQPELAIENDTVQVIPDPVQAAPDTLISAPFLSGKVTQYNGSWFSIAYPEEFTPSPTTPVDHYDQYEFVETDEARFVSADGEVEFFVYSPQWGGDPGDYLEVAEGEEVESDKTEAEEVMPTNIHRWCTLKSKDGAYTRAFYSKKTETTHLVFGIRYKSQEVYEQYKEAYIAFKKSLEQYAD